MKTKTTKLALECNGEYLSRHAGSLVVRTREGIKQRFPLFENKLSMIELRSGNVVSTGALTTAACWKIPVIIETSRGHAVGILNSIYSQSYVKTRVSQYESLRKSKGIAIAKAFLVSKLESQNMLLEKYGKRKFDLFRLKQTIKGIHGKDLNSVRARLNSVEGRCANRYFAEVFELYDEDIRPEKRIGFKAFDAINNLHNLGYTFLKWRIHLALITSHLEPYLGYLHGLSPTQPSLVCDFLELYRYLIDNFNLGYVTKAKIKRSDFALKKEDYTRSKKGYRQYLKDTLQNEYLKRLNAYFESVVDIPRMRRGKRQELETVINEEALLFAQYLRGEKRGWIPRIPSLAC